MQNQNSKQSEINYDLHYEALSSEPKDRTFLSAQALKNIKVLAVNSVLVTVAAVFRSGRVALAPVIRKQTARIATRTKRVKGGKYGGIN
jgi:hypothetical protein